MFVYELVHYRCLRNLALCKSCYLLTYYSAFIYKVNALKYTISRTAMMNSNITACLLCWIHLFRLTGFLPHCMHLSSHEKAVCLSVPLSVCLSIRPSARLSNSDLWPKESKLCPHSYTTWKIIYPSFVTRRMVGLGRPLVPKILGQTDPAASKSPMFSRYSLIEPQP